MAYKRLLTGFAACVGMLILVLDGQTAIVGAQTGLELCIKTVIPSLFPFFVLSLLLTNALTGTSLPILSPVSRLVGIPNGAESLLLSGFLGGYPAGAQCISAVYRSGNLKKEDAETMLAFCNNAGPAFLFGMVASFFPQRWMTWALWGIHIASALLTAQFFPKCGHSLQFAQQPDVSFTESLISALRITASVCGWIVIFRVIIAFSQRWFLWLLPVEVQVTLIGLLELSNGCCVLSSISDVSHRFIICSVLLALGGLCVTMQTVSATSGLSLSRYFKGKILQAFFSLLLSFALIYRLWLSLFILVPVIAYSILQKNSSIHAAVGV